MGNFLHYPGAIEALTTSLLFGSFLAFLGIPLVLRRRAFTGVALSETAALGAAVGTLFNAPRYIIPFVLVLGVLILLELLRSRRTGDDGPVAVVYLTAAAVATLFVSKLPTGEADLLVIHFGNILALSSAELWTGTGLVIVGERTLQEPNLDQPTFLIVRVSVCRCDTPACDRKYFRVPLPFALPGARYPAQAKQWCVSSIPRDGMPFGRVPERVADDFHLYPSKSTVWEWHRQQAEEVDLTVDYAPWVKAQFSGGLCIDEVYDGPFCLILSTDPLNDVTVAYTLEKKAKGTQRPMMNQEWLDRHLEERKRIGIHPQVVMRDGAVVYDEGLPEEWKQARCIFHLLQDITDEVLKAVNASRKSLPDAPKRPRRRLVGIGATPLRYWASAGRPCGVR